MSKVPFQAQCLASYDIVTVKKLETVVDRDYLPAATLPSHYFLAEVVVSTHGG